MKPELVSPQRLLWAVLAWLVLTLGLVWGGHALAVSLVSVLQTVMGGMSDYYRPASLTLVQNGADWVFSVSVKTAYARTIHGFTLPAEAALTSSTLMGHAFQPLSIAFVMLVLIPSQTLSRWFVRLLLTGVLVSVVLLLDTPCVLIGSLEDLILANTDPAQLSHSGWVWAMNFFNGGGRLGLGLLAGVLPLWAVSGRPPR